MVGCLLSYPWIVLFVLWSDGQADIFCNNVGGSLQLANRDLPTGPWVHQSAKHAAGKKFSLFFLCKKDLYPQWNYHSTSSNWHHLSVVFLVRLLVLSSAKWRRSGRMGWWDGRCLWWRTPTLCLHKWVPWLLCSGSHRGIVCHQCTMCILGTMFSFQPNKLRHILKDASW